jgi:hypothetical protein
MELRARLRSVVRSGLTRAIQKHYGYRPVPVTCRDCGLSRPSLETFPSGGIFGLSALAWVASGRRPIFSTGIECPRCHRPLTWHEDVVRRRKHS